MENLAYSLILEEPMEIEIYERVIRLLVARALPEGESLRLIIELARRWEQDELA